MPAWSPEPPPYGPSPAETGRQQLGDRCGAIRPLGWSSAATEGPAKKKINMANLLHALAAGDAGKAGTI